MSSFKKRVPSAQATLPAGCRLSAYNGQVLISSGVPSLDDILGGGIPLGTIVLIQEDRQTSYGQLLLKYFLRQGIVAGDECVVVSGDESPEAMVRHLMGAVGEEQSTSVAMDLELENDLDHKTSSFRKKAGGGQEDSEEDRLTIAWRYSGLKKFESGVAERPGVVPKQPVDQGPQSPATPLLPSQIPFCEQFDLTTRISTKILESANTTLIDSGDFLTFGGATDEEFDNGDDVSADQYAGVLGKIRERIIKGGYSTTLAPIGSTTKSAKTPAAAAKGLAERHVCRIGINSIASPSWRSKTPHDLYKFLHALRGLLRFSFGAAVITIPAHLYGTIDQRHVSDGSTLSPFIRKIEQMCDASFRIESFAGALTNAASAASAYHGLFHVHKVPVLNSLIPSSTKLSILLDGSGGGGKEGKEGSTGGSGPGGGNGGQKGVNNLGFKVRRKRFAIETFHLPPEGGVGSRRTSSESGGSSKSSSKGTSKKLSELTGSAPSRLPSTSSLSSSPASGGASSFSRASSSSGGSVSINNVPGASGMARKMMGLPPKGIEGAVATGCSTSESPLSTDRQPHGHSHGSRPHSHKPALTAPSHGNNPLDF